MENQKNWTGNIHQDLKRAKEFLYDKCNYEYTYPMLEAESADYAACTFLMNGLSIKYRVAKITPTKIGQFVTLWKRNGKGPIEPFDDSDMIDLFVISTKKDKNFGQFVFPKSALCKHGIISHNKKIGKRAMRVYPPWDKTTSKQAQSTQKWQLDFFLEIPKDKAIDKTLSNSLYLNQSQT